MDGKELEETTLARYGTSTTEIRARIAIALSKSRSNNANLYSLEEKVIFPHEVQTVQNPYDIHMTLF